METKQSARELLREAWEILADAKSDGKDGLSEGTLSVIGKVMADIDSYLAAPSESAMEMVVKIEKIYADADCHVNDSHTSIVEYSELLRTARKDAAALIEGLQRRVPRKMLREIYHQTASGANPFSVKSVDNYLNAIAAKHDVVIE